MLKRATILVSACCLATAAFGAENTSKTLRLLWLGSSSMYYHNQPKVLAEWLTRVAHTPARSEIAGRSGTGVHVYLRDGFKAEYGLKPQQTVLGKIAQENYDYVVLQIPAEFIAGPEGDEHDRSLDVYCQAIRAAGGEPIFYEMGWGRDEKAELGRGKILAAAQRNDIVRYAPCSSAWARVRRECPDLELQNPPDTAHPGTLGAYLNLCCFYAAVTGRSPALVPRQLKIWPHLSDQEKTEFNARAKQVEFDEYDRALSGWMKKFLVAARPIEIEPETATYLQRVAWEEHQRFQKELRP